MPDQTGGHPYVFVSYASVDRDRVLPIIDRLEAAGVKTWIDRDGIHGGANYAKVIAEAIEHASAMLLMCSEASFSSRNVKQELALAWRFEKPYLPLLLDPVEIPKDVAYWLEGSQWIELLDHSTETWLANVADALKRHGFEVAFPSESTQSLAVRRARPLLVGREREQTQLREQLERMLAGQGGTILVGGEAGIGKSTLVEDLSAEAEERGCLVLWGHAYDLSVTPPYGPWLEIFRQYRTYQGQPVPIPAFVGGAEDLARVGSQETLFDLVSTFFEDLASHVPVLLILDDLHWADAGSLDFFRLLARRARHSTILLVATYRTDELHRHHPLYDLLPLVIREANAERIDVRPLTGDDCQRLVSLRYALTSMDQFRLISYLNQHAGGNPLYAGEILRSLEEDGTLKLEESTCLLGDLDRVNIPPLLRQVIGRRLDRLSERSRELLQIGSVIGQSVSLDLWQRVSGADETELVEALQSGRSASLLDEHGGETWIFDHALIRETLFQEMVSLRRRSIHRTVAEALAAQSNADPDQVAYHYQQASDANALEWLVRAAERAERAYAWQTAADRFESLLPLIETEPSRIELAGWVTGHIARLLRFSDQPR
ncbi:MAG: AAA family ATPase, partial [Nitrolancea sp.]